MTKEAKKTAKGKGKVQTPPRKAPKDTSKKSSPKTPQDTTEGRESYDAGSIVRSVRPSNTGMVVLCLILLAIFGSIGYYVYNNYDEAMFLLNKFFYGLAGKRIPKPDLTLHTKEKTPMLPEKPSPYPHLKYGMPGNARVIDWPGFALGYHRDYKQSVWAIYRLSGENQALALPMGSFHTSQGKGIVCAEPSDYCNSAFLPAQLASAEDVNYDKSAYYQSFDMLNTAPMHPALRQGPWSALEKQVRFLLKSEGELYVVSGTTFSAFPQKRKTIGDKHIPVPSHFYKIIFSPKNKGKMIGFWFPNDETCKGMSWRNFIVSVESIEKNTDLNFFNTISKDIQKQMKQTFSLSDWYWSQD